MQQLGRIESLGHMMQYIRRLASRGTVKTQIIGQCAM